MRRARLSFLLVAVGVCVPSMLAVQAAASQRTVAPAFSGVLPVGPGQTVTVSQGNGPDAFDHVGLQQYAFDFVVGQQNFLIAAAQGGTVIGLNDASNVQCSGLDWESHPVSQALSGCWAHANFVLIKDDDSSTASLYMHILQGSTCSAQFCVKVGQHVNQGSPLARAGTTGWSTGIHLHFQAESIPIPQQDPYSGWWFTQSVPAHFTNTVVTAQDSDGIPQTGQVFKLGTAPPAPVAQDWKNHRYDLTCDDVTKQPINVAVRDGQGTATGSNIGGYKQWIVKIQQIASGTLPSLGGVTAVLFYCSPQPSNFFNQELRIYRTSDGSEIGRIPGLQVPGANLAGTLPGVFNAGSVAIRSGQVTADAMLYGPGDSHASGPSILRHFAWTWNGHGFTSLSSPSQIAPTGACPASAQLLAAWTAAPAALRESWAGVPLTGFRGISCWKDWVVAEPVALSQGNGEIVFSQAGDLHLITTAELQQQFRSEVCSSSDAPTDWRYPPLISCT